MKLFLDAQNHAAIYKTDLKALKKKEITLSLINEFSNSGWQEMNPTIVSEYIKIRKCYLLLKSI